MGDFCDKFGRLTVGEATALNEAVSLSYKDKLEDQPEGK